MKTLRQILWLFVFVEIIGAAVVLTPRLTRPVPELPNLDAIDPITAEALRELRDRARDGGFQDWRELAEALLGNGFYSHAEQCFRRAAQLDPNDVGSVFGTGFCLQRTGRTAESTPYLRKAASLANDDLRQTCWYEIGRNALREEDPDRAEAAFRRIDGFSPARYQLAKLLIRTGRAEEALGIIDRDLQSMPNSLKFLQLRAWAEQALGRAGDAARSEDRLTRAEYQLNLEYSDDYIEMFAIKFGLRKQVVDCLQSQQSASLDEQHAALAQILQIIRKNGLWQFQGVYDAAIDLDLKRNQPHDALKLLDEIDRHNYPTAESLARRGDALTQLGRDREARDAWQRSFALAPNSDVLRKLAESFRRTGDEASAAINTARADQFDGIAAYRRNDLNTAVDRLKHAVELQPDSARSWFYLGEANRARGRVADAKSALQRCLKHNPDDFRAAESLQRLTRDASE